MENGRYEKYISKDVQSSVLVQPDDIIYTRTGQIGLAFRGFTGCVHNNSFVVTLNSNEITKDYLFTLLNSQAVRNQALSLAKNSVQPDLTHDMFKSIVVYVPDLKTQNAVASFYNTISLKIANNNAICSNLEAMAKLLYDYWFVQFDFPDENGKPYKSSGGKMAWNEDLKRKIPAGWEVGNIIDNPLSKIIGTGIDFFNSKNYLPTANVVGESIIDGDWITFNNRESRANMQPTVYSVWFAKMKNSIKHISIPFDSEWFTNKYILSTGFEGIQCTKSSFGYIHCVVNSEYFEKHKDMLAHGATQESVNEDDLKNIKFVIPNYNIIELFSEKLNPILEYKFKLFYENQQLASFRDFFLPMLMNGQVKVGA